MRCLAVCLSVGLLLIPASAQDKSSSASAITIIPAPRQLIPSPGTFRISASTRIILGDRTSREDVAAVEALNEELILHGASALKDVQEKSLRSFKDNVIYIGLPDSRRGKDVLARKNAAFSDAMREEGYILAVDNGSATVLAPTARGRFYGIMSLLQMLRKEKRSIVVPAAVIHDWPLQKVRGITDDISRGQVSTIENFKKIIRFMARYKMNVYSPYLEDLFVFKNHPLVGKGRGALTAADVRDLDAYAKRRFVDMIPIFETLGHWENILIKPEYLPLAEFPGAHTLNISDERIYAILDEMIGELAAAFSSPYFNMAADESWDVGLGANKERVQKSDLATVHAEHYKQLFDIIAKHGKKPMMYGDIILNNPGILDQIPKSVVIVDWQYWAGDRYSSPSVFRTAGFPFVVSPAVYNFAGPFPNYVHTLINIRNFCAEGYGNGSLGLLTSNWNDYGGEALRELNYYGYAWTAECAWNPDRSDLDQFNTAFFSDFFGSSDAGTSVLAAYTMLSDPLNLISWHELWRHPMLPPRQSNLNPLWRIQGIRLTAPQIRRFIAAARSSAVRNQDHLQYLEFIVDNNLWFARKLEASETVRRLTQSPPPGSDVDSIRTAVLNVSKDIVPELMKLKEEYRRVWLTTNQEANLEWLMKRYDRQAAYWTEKIEQVRGGEIWVEPTISSQWIYHPDGNPGKRDSAFMQVPKVSFRKDFTIPDTFALTGSFVQLIGDTRARLTLNGTPLGEVFARRSLSLIVEQARVKCWDVSANIRKGMNTLTVEAENFNNFGSAGVNVFCQITGAGGAVVVAHSDSTWEVSKSQIEPPVWVQARVTQHPWAVVAPHPASGRSSWIER